MNNSHGVFQTDCGTWGYRFTVVIDGQKYSSRRTTDEQGIKYKTKSEAKKARETAIAELRTKRSTKPPMVRKTFAEVYEEYAKTGRNRIKIADNFIHILRVVFVAFLNQVLKNQIRFQLLVWLLAVQGFFFHFAITKSSISYF